MSYVSFEFFVLFAMTMTLYYTIPFERARFWVLLSSSLIFYAWAGTFDFAVFIAVVLVTYLTVCCARWMPAYRKLFLYSGIAVLVVHLFFWKYLPWAGTLWKADFHLPLPLGISFFTLQGIAYLVDVQRRDAAFMSLKEFLLFKTFFAQLIAGPIVRAKEVIPYLRKLPRASAQDIQEGLFRICLGMFKKLVIADHMAIFVETVFSNPSRFSGDTLVLAALGFYFQIWGDFSGYTDIGRGCAMLLGWRLPENFYSPLYALSPTDWARRWHVTLGRWVLLYVYVPVAKKIRVVLKFLGRRRRWPKQAISLAIALITVGLWHGAAVNFFVYGLALCFFFYCEILFRRASPLWRSIPKPIAYVAVWMLFFPIEIVITILFRSRSLEAMSQFFSGIVLAEGAGQMSLLPYAGGIIWRIAAVFAIEAIMYFDLRERRYPVADFLGAYFAVPARRYPRTASVIIGFALAVSFVWALSMRTGDNLNSFIYFRF